MVFFFGIFACFSWHFQPFRQVTYVMHDTHTFLARQIPTVMRDQRIEWNHTVINEPDIAVQILHGLKSLVSGIVGLYFAYRSIVVEVLDPNWWRHMESQFRWLGK